MALNLFLPFDRVVANDGLMDLDQMLGSFTGTLTVQDCRNGQGRVFTNYEVICERVQDDATDVNYQFELDGQQFNICSEMLIKFEDKVFVKGIGRQAAYGDPKFDSDYHLYHACHSFENGIIELTFRHKDDGCFYFYKGQLIP
ncbi:hypothetical protein [Carboxylicivirga sp. N1Y90]|uniref:hypothetical protein n=1 Tax=Carboxylicivirga fragile TaxID=3417571 RepID=UPI003D344C9D|nr:hypothetical protein [Marinilabiliaceae bacterium N1Y90]